jgi:mRNA interferase HigB
MRIVSQKRLREYGQKHPQLRAALTHWRDTVEEANWSDVHDVRRTFRDADPVKVASRNTVWVFNIKSHRMVAAVHFNRAVVYMLRLMKHAEYDRGKWKDQL